MSQFSTHLTRAVSLTALVILLCSFTNAQKKRVTKKPVVIGPTVTRIDIEGLKKLLKPNGKPLLINFWATWCDPCREEFPDLVKLDAAYKGKIDFITISLDDVADIKTSVPGFLRQMKAQMPAYLLSTPDENEAITLVSKDWAGSLPLTVLYGPNGKLSYTRAGKINHETVVTEIDRVLSLATAPVYVVLDFVKIVDGRSAEAAYFYENNWKVYREEAFKRGVIDSFDIVKSNRLGDSYDILLITRYRSKEQFEASEKNFEPILKALRPDGPKLLNNLNPNEFRQNAFAYQGPQIPVVN